MRRLARGPAGLLVASIVRPSIASVSHERKVRGKCGRGHTAIVRIVNSEVEGASTLAGQCGRPIASRHHRRRVARDEPSCLARHRPALRVTRASQGERRFADGGDGRIEEDGRGGLSVSAPPCRSKSDGSPTVESACGSSPRGVTFPQRVAHSKAITTGESDG